MPEALTFPIACPCEEPGEAEAEAAAAAEPTMDAALAHLEMACASVCHQSGRASTQARDMKRRISSSTLQAVQPPGAKASLLDLDDLLDTGITTASGDHRK